MCFDDNEPVPTKRVAPCGHDERFIDWEDHGKPIACLKCECGKLQLQCDTWEYTVANWEARLAAAEDALQALYDYQNGCPLPTYRVGWTAAMVAAENVLRDADKRLEKQIAAKEVAGE